jgi:hypothetical protein
LQALADDRSEVQRHPVADLRRGRKERAQGLTRKRDEFRLD